MNTDVRIEHGLSVDDFIALRSTTGWGVPDRAVSQAALDASLVCLTARLDGGAVGMIRAVGDGYLNAYLQDLVVHPSLRRHGVGRALIDRVCRALACTAPPYLTVGLMAARDMDPFYVDCGFRARPNADQGAGFQAALQNIVRRSVT